MLIMQQKKDFFIDALHIFVLFSFALAQPLFDLLSRNAEFFVARHSKPVDVIFLILILCALLPALVVLIEVVAGLFGQRARKVIHYFMVASLLAIIALPMLKKIFELPGTVLIVGSAVLGIAVAIAYLRFHAVRMFLTVLSLSILIIPGLFLFNSPVSKVVFAGEESAGVYAKVDATAPVIMVVFDEFPVTSLMDEHRRIDPIRYPNFAALAQDAYWFRNATTVAEGTLLAIPAIMCGSYPDPCGIPTAPHYPHNLFTLLGSSYRMKVFESHTMICPETLCGADKRYQIFTRRMHSMLLDLSAVYLHIVLPFDLTAGLPIVTQTWKEFGGETKVNKVHVPTMNNVMDKALASYKDRAGLFAEFIESITISDKPTLYFLDIILPHVPWQYLPSGKLYTGAGWEIPGLNKEKWGENDWLVIQGYQRHLLQVGFVDKLVGDLLAKLKALNLYDRSLIIITADHGVNFWHSKLRRRVLKSHPMDIVGIPLFIKAPNQHEGVISDRNVKTIDILPTIADILDIHLPWPVDGRSALDTSLPDGAEKVEIIRKGISEPLVFKRNLGARYDTLKRKLALFGSGTKSDGLFEIGHHNNLVGRRLGKLSVAKNASVAIEVDQMWLYHYVDPKATFVPTYITGHVRTNRVVKDSFNLAVAVNGTIRAVTQTFDNEECEAKFAAIVSETAFRTGKNDIEVFILSTGPGGQLNLMATKSQRQFTYSLSSSGKTLIRHPDSTSMQIIPNALQGWVSSAVKGGHVYFSGWAADVKNSQLPEAIILFMNGKFLYSGRTEKDRPDVAKHFNNPALRKTGFNFVLPLSLLEDTASPEIRFFAVLNDVASELNYPKGYEWGKNEFKVSVPSESDRQFQMIHTKGQSQVTYSLSVSSKLGETITSSDGESVPVIPNALKGHLDIADVGSGRVVFAGWAADIKNSQPAETIVVFKDGKFLHSGRADIDRPDVAKHFDNPALERTGFKFVLPLSLLKDTASSEVRFFAVLNDVASELVYTKDYSWGKK